MSWATCTSSSVDRSAFSIRQPEAPESVAFMRIRERSELLWPSAT